MVHAADANPFARARRKIPKQTSPEVPKAGFGKIILEPGLLGITCSNYQTARKNQRHISARITGR